VTRMVSESLDRTLPLHQRLGIRMHLMMCRYCNRYRKQLLLLRQIFRSESLSDEPSAPPPVALSQDARERMKQALRTATGK